MKAYPLVSALLLVGEEQDSDVFCRAAVRCFLSQTWYNRELIIAHPGTFDVNPEKHDTVRDIVVAGGSLGCRRQVLLDAAQGRSFEWGVHDCCLWAADAVLATTGVDLAVPWRGTFSTEGEATALLDALGGLRALGALGGPECKPALAGAGDVGLIEHGGRGWLAVHDGAAWICPTREGFVRWPTRAARCAWKVGAAHG